MSNYTVYGVFTTYFINAKDAFNKVTSNKTTSKANLKILLSISFILCVTIFTSSCTTHYPDTQSSSGHVGNSKPIVIRGTSRPVAPYLEQRNERLDRKAVSSAQSSVTVPPQQEERISSPKKLIPKRLINIASLNNGLFEASEQGDINAIRRLLGQGADILASNTNGETALHSAAAHNKVDAARILIENGADVNALTVSGWSPLHSAARFGSTDVVLVLLRSGVNTSHNNVAGRTALSLAKQAQHFDVVRVLQNR